MTTTAIALQAAAAVAWIVEAVRGWWLAREVTRSRAACRRERLAAAAVERPLVAAGPTAY